MHNNIKINIIGANGKTLSIEGTKSYFIDSKLYEAADEYSVELSHEYIDNINIFDKINFMIDGNIVLVGLIENIVFNRQTHSIVVSGRDYTGLLVDCCCEDFGESFDLNGKTIKQITEKLIAKVPYVQRSNIVYDVKNITDTIHGLAYISPGEKVFDVLARMALARGLLFYNTSDGKFVFAEPKKTRDKKEVFELYYKEKEKNILSGDCSIQTIGVYNRIVAIGQTQQYIGGLDVGTINTKVIARDKEMFPITKTIVTSNQTDEKSSAYAKGQLDKQRANMINLSYTVAGHSQGNRIWEVNEVCHVYDEFVKVQGKIINKDYIIYSRRFIYEGSDEGQKTELQLGEMGLKSA